VGTKDTGLAKNFDLYSHLLKKAIDLPLSWLRANRGEQGTMMENATILLVEDNADDEILTLRAFKANDIEKKVFVVRDGAEALDFLFCRNSYADRDPRDLPRLILLDLKLPKIDGPTVLRRLRDDPRTRLLRVVMLTSSTEEQGLIESYESGANSYLRKPVDYNQFVEFVGHLGSYWLGLNEAPPR
jgi:two-component system response regulator